MDETYTFDASAIQAVELSQNLCVGLPFVPLQVFLVSLFMLPNTPVNTYIKYNTGNTEDDIFQDGLNVLNQSSIEIDSSSYTSLEIEDYSYCLDNSIWNLIKCAGKIAKDCYGEDIISSSHIIVAFADSKPTEYTRLLSSFINNFKTRPSSLKPSEQTAFRLPKSMESFLSVMNTKYSSDEQFCRICGRDEETKQLTRVLCKTTKRNAILVGDPGVGKTALVEKFTWMIVTGNCPDKFKNSIVVSLDVNAIVAGTQYRGMAEQRFQDLIAFLNENPECILFIDEIHLLLGAGACKDGDLDLANALKPILARGITQVIGATTSSEYKEYFSKDGALKRRFEKIVVAEPKADEVYHMIKNQIAYLEKAHHAKISKDMVDFVILNASCFNYENKNPDRTLDLIDKTLVCAELAGKSRVSRSDVLENFAINCKKFKKMSNKSKMSTAYHEAGHYILHHYSEQLSDFKTMAVSIMPAEDYLGVNVFEIDSDVTPTESKQYFIQLLGSYLAGRIAEEMYTHELSAGASSDLTKATCLAKDMVTKYGLDTEFTQDRVFLRDSENPMYTDNLITEINTHMNTLLSEARAYATELLNSKRAYLDALAIALVEHGILSESDINKLFKHIDN